MKKKDYQNKWFFKNFPEKIQYKDHFINKFKKVLNTVINLEYNKDYGLDKDKYIVVPYNGVKLPIGKSDFLTWK